jgi:hypothetical protein
MNAEMEVQLRPHDTHGCRRHGSRQPLPRHRCTSPSPPQLHGSPGTGTRMRDGSRRKPHTGGDRHVALRRP